MNASKSSAVEDAEPSGWTEAAGYPPPRRNHAGRLTSELAGAGLGEVSWDGQVGGWLVKTTAAHHVHVLPMAYSYRVQTSVQGFPVRHWCYAGLGSASFVAAVLAAHAWDGSDITEPVGWNKNGQSGEWREPAS